MKRPFAAIVRAMRLVSAAPAWPYDRARAESQAQLFAPVQGADAGKALPPMSPEAARAPCQEVR